jgi:AcrR family transcriptional regulator
VPAEDRVAERRRRLLDAGLELFGTRGVAAVGVGDVCREAGLTKRYFYESFPSIDELVEAVIEDVLERLTEVVAPLINERDVRPALVAVWEALLADARLVRLLIVETTSGSLTRYRDRLLTHAVETWLARVRPRSRDARIAAFAYAGAGGELACAWLDGRIDLSLDELLDWLVRLYTMMSEIRQTPSRRSAIIKK